MNTEKRPFRGLKVKFFFLLLFKVGPLPSASFYFCHTSALNFIYLPPSYSKHHHLLTYLCVTSVVSSSILLSTTYNTCDLIIFLLEALQWIPIANQIKSELPHNWACLMFPTSFCFSSHPPAVILASFPFLIPVKLSLGAWTPTPPAPSLSSCCWLVIFQVLAWLSTP